MACSRCARNKAKLNNITNNNIVNKRNQERSKRDSISAISSFIQSGEFSPSLYRNIIAKVEYGASVDPRARSYHAELAKGASNVKEKSVANQNLLSLKNLIEKS